MSDGARYPRKTDIATWLNLLIMAGLIWTAYGKPASWDQAKKDVDEIRPIVQDDHTKMAVVISQLESMNRHLESIDRKTGR